MYAQTFAPTRFPHQGPQYVDSNAMTQNWLYSGANTATGDYTGANVVFFSVPDTTTSTLYFAVRNPDVDADATLANSEPDLSVANGPPWVNYTLIGGTGAYSAAAGQHLTYANANSGGTVLDTIAGSSYTGAFRVGTWVYFNGVLPKQGEHIGNRYYFRLTAVTPGYGVQEFKHCYQFDVSLANSGTPTGLSSGYAFSYDITFAQLSAAVSTAETWDFYPFVPYGSGSPMTATTNAFNYAGSNTIVVNAWDDNLGVSQGVAGFPMGSGTATNTYTVSSAQTNATWHLQIATTGNLGGRASGAAELYFSVGGKLLPIYTTPYSGPAPDHFVLSPSSSSGLTGTNLSYRAQLVDAGGNPLSYIATVKVATTGGALINGVSGTQTLTTDTTGGVNFTVSDAPAETVNLGLTSDGTGGTTSLPGVDGSATAAFTTNPNPTVSSANDLTFAQGSTANQPVITISANGGTRLTTNGIKIQIPSSLSANFGTTPPNAVLTAGTGTLGTPTVSGNVVTIPITAALSTHAVVTVGSVTPISYTSTNSASSGFLQLSFDGGATYPVSDNKIVVVQAPLYTWNGSTSTAWNNGSNWTPAIAGGPPTTANVRISAAPLYPIVTTTTGNGGGSTITANNLIVDAGASLTLNGATAITVNGAFSNSGTFTLNGNESVNLTNSTATGTVVYAGTGSYTGLAMGTSYYNLTVSSGTYTLSSNITVNGNVTLSGGTVSAGSQTIGLYGNWTDSGGTFTAGSSTLQLMGTSTSVISGAVAPNGFNAFTCTAAGKSIQFATGTTQTLGVLTITGSPSSNISLAGTSAATWTINVASSSVSYANIAYSTVSPGQTAYYSTNSGNNSGWTFQSFTAWTGGAGSTSWATAGNWSNGVPSTGVNVTINPASYQPVLAAATASLGSLTIASGATLDLSGFGTGLNASGTMTVNGTLKMQGGETLTNVTGITGTGTVQLYGTGSYTVPSFSYYALTVSAGGIFNLANPLIVASNLTVSAGTLAAGANSITVGGNLNFSGITAYSGSGLVTMDPSTTATLRSGGQTLPALTVSSGSVSLGAPLTLSGNLSISSGATLNGSSSTLSVAGTWDNLAGATGFSAGTGTVSLTSTTSQQVLGSTSFNNLSCTVAGQTMQFAAGATQTVTGTFTVTGTPAGTIKLLSTSSGSQWFISAAASSIAYAWVQDSGVTGGANIGTTADSSHNNGNNTTSPPTTPGWVFPSASSISWTGGTSTSWNVGSNWSSGYVPNSGDTVTVNNVGAQPATLTANVTLAGLTVGSGATVDLAGYALAATGSASLGGTVGNSSGSTASFTVSAGGSTTVTNTASISGGGNPVTISLGGTVNGGFGLTLNAGSSTVSIAGTVGGTTPLASLTVSSTNGAANAIDLQAVTTSGAQSYSGALTVAGTLTVNTAGSGVSVSGATTIVAGGGTITLTGSSSGNVVSMGSVNGAQPLSITAGGGSVALGVVGGTVSVSSVSVGGTTAPTIGIQSVTSVGTQSYGGSVTLGASATLTTTNSNVTLSSTVNGTSAGAQGLTVSAGSGLVSIGGAVGGTTALSTVSLTSSAAAANAITMQSVTTSGAQGYTGNVTHGASATLTTTNSNVTFSAGVNGTAAGTQGLTVSAGSGLVGFGGAVGGTTALASLSVTSSAAAANAITIQSVTTAAVGGTQSYTGNVTLAAAATLTTNNSAVTFGGTVDGTAAGADGLTLALGSGTASAGGTIGGTKAIGALVLTSGTLAMGSYGLFVGGNVSRTGGVLTSGAMVTLNGTAAGQTVDFTGATLTSLTADNTYGTAPQVTLASAVTLPAGGVFSDTAGTLNMNGHAIAVGGTASRGATIENTGAAALFSVTGATTLTGNASITTNGANATFGSTVQSPTTAYSLSVTKAGATLTFGGAVGGGGNPLLSLTTDAGGTVALNGGAVTTTTTQGYGGPVTLGAATTISTTNSNVTFSSTVQSPTTAYALGVTKGTGTLTLSGAVGGGGNPLLSLTTDAGGTVALNGGAVTTTTTQGYGGPASLGSAATTLTTTNSNVTFSGTVDGAAAGADGLSVAVGGGLVSFGAAVGGTIPLASLSVTSSAPVANAITIQNVTTSGAAPTQQTYTGAVTLGASAVFTANNGAIKFTSTIDATTAGVEGITCAAGTGTVTIGGAIGGSTPIGNLTINSGSVAFGANNVTLYGNWTNVAGSFSFTSAATVTFETGAGAGTPTVTSSGSSFANITISKGSGTGTALSTTDALSVTGTTGVLLSTANDSLNVESYSFTISKLSFNGANGTFLLSGNQPTQSITSFDTASGSVEYEGGVTANIAISTGPANTFYNLVINSPGGSYTLTSSITVENNLWILAGALAAGSSSITLGHDWNKAGGPYGSFAPGTGTVTLDGAVNSGLSPAYTYTISGSNSFYRLVCDYTLVSQNAGATIDIEAGTTQTILAGGGYLDVQGRVDSPVGNYAGNWITVQSTSPPTQWDFNLTNGAALNLLKYVTIRDSRATPNNVPVPANVNAGAAYNDTSWLTTIPVVASWTVDSNNDGKIDGIVVQVAAAVNDDFSGFHVSVSGYTVAGFSTNVAGYTGGPQANDQYFTILLNPGPNLDTNATPTWTITSNSTLLDYATGNQYVGPSNVVYTPSDIAPPIVAYSLAIAGMNQLFVAFSEPVVESGGAAVAPADFTFSNGATVTNLTPVLTAGGGTQQVLLTLSQSVTATDELAPTTFTVSALRDLAAPSGTAPPTGLTNGPNSIPATLRTHRISDLGLGLPGQGIVEPIWAKDQSQVDPLRGGAGIIHTFDGSGWLQAQTITMQSYVTDSYATAGSLVVSVRFDSGVSSSLKSGNLWLPPFNTTQYNGIVPYADPAAQTVSSALDTPNQHIRDSVVPSTSSLIKSGNTIQFFFEIAGPDPLLCASLPNPGASNWYQLVQPWAFKLQNIATQRGEVTILHNVINPNYGEHTNLVYTVTQGGMVTINVFDLAGDLVNTLYSGQEGPGQYSTSWDGRNFNGHVVARGIYFIRVVAPGIDEFRKVLVVK